MCTILFVGKVKGIVLMIEFLPEDVVDGLARGRKSAATKRTRLRVRAGDEMIPLLRLTGRYFTIDSTVAPKLRGLVDIYDGTRHLYQALVVAASLEGDAVVFEFKRNTATASGPALDFVREEAAPVALLAQH